MLGKPEGSPGHCPILHKSCSKLALLSLCLYLHIDLASDISPPLSPLPPCLLPHPHPLLPSVPQVVQVAAWGHAVAAA